MPLLAACGLLAWASMRLILEGEHLPQTSGLVYGGFFDGGLAVTSDSQESLDMVVPIEPVNEAGWASLEPPIIITKGDHVYDKVVSSKRTRWRYLSESLRQQIRETLDQSPIAWRRLVVHASGSEAANASLLAKHQRLVRPTMGSLAYHFVVGNGSYSSLGAIEVGPR